jgi:hypothetical protein
MGMGQDSSGIFACHRPRKRTIQLLPKQALDAPLSRGMTSIFRALGLCVKSLLFALPVVLETARLAQESRPIQKLQ